ncbi:MAG: FAD-binding oxidoreductase [Cyclobacteriaceae bacterium]|nr:MAG: FAD-binding oxidoreductase [Cyclobacteriaceae bacterium]
MAFPEVSVDILSEFEAIIGKENVILDEEKRSDYAHDKTEDYHFLPAVVLKPGTPEEISRIMQLCHEHRVPVTPRGAGTGLAGAALPTHHGVVLSMERFNKILQIDELNLQATVEPGVITEVFQNAVKEKGLFYPPDPASSGSCFFGWKSFSKFWWAKSSKVWRYPRLCFES